MITLKHLLVSAWNEIERGIQGGISAHVSWGGGNVSVPRVVTVVPNFNIRGRLYATVPSSLIGGG